MAKKKKKTEQNQEPVANCDQFKEVIGTTDYPEKGEITLSQYDIEKLIVTVRGDQVLIDRDLAYIYQVEVKQMNRQVKRNIERFPEDFYVPINKRRIS